MKAAAVCALLLALGGCRTRPYQAVSTQSCVTHTREAIPLADLAFESDYGRTQARLLFGLPLRRCDAPAAVSATVGADGRMHLAAGVWRSTADCGDPRRVEHPLTVADGAYDFVDDTSGRDLGTLLLGTLGTPSGSCNPIPESSGCTDDCQCEASDPSLRCLGLLGNHGICARPCAFDRDCPESMRPRCTTETSVHFVCYSTSDDCCTPDSCGAGFTCSGCTCRPMGPAGGDCRCDADCASGICGDGTCVTPA